MFPLLFVTVRSCGICIHYVSSRSAAFDKPCLFWLVRAHVAIRQLYWYLMFRRDVFSPIPSSVSFTECTIRGLCFPSFFAFALAPLQPSTIHFPEFTFPSPAVQNFLAAECSSDQPWYPLLLNCTVSFIGAPGGHFAIESI
mmetsp:Transcript_14616/g.24938  ORF Transcript_14616/g.24938 Transcript_14616/m.24938 type:complete len:141 (-) Transcript_14616:50-472(-)